MLSTPYQHKVLYRADGFTQFPHDTLPGLAGMSTSENLLRTIQNLENNVEPVEITGVQPQG